MNPCTKKQKVEKQHQLFTMLPIHLERYIFGFDSTYRTVYDKVIQTIPQHFLCYFTYTAPYHVYRTLDCSITVTRTDGTEVGNASTDTCMMFVLRAVSEDLDFIQRHLMFGYTRFPMTRILEMLEELRAQVDDLPRKNFTDTETISVQLEVNDENDVCACDIVYMSTKN